MDELEIWFDRGVTDGLPVIPPTRERVERMLGGATRERDQLLGEMPPNYGRATVEKVAINAVMAGCRPEYLPVVLAAVEAACAPAFNLHGVSTSTHFSAPLIVVNGPIRSRIGLNCGFGVFGPGYRANATIGRALRLVMINVGGAKPGETSMSTFGHPGRYTYCIGEHEEASPWPPYHVERGFAAEQSAVTLFAGEGPHGISDHSSRAARALAGSIGWSLVGLWNAKHFPLYSHTMLVVGPEHARTFGDDGWSKDDLKRHLFETVRVPYRTLQPDEDNGEGTNLRFARDRGPGPDERLREEAKPPNRGDSRSTEIDERLREEAKPPNRGDSRSTEMDERLREEAKPPNQIHPHSSELDDRLREEAKPPSRIHPHSGEMEELIPKFPSVNEIHVVVAGGTAGRFSMAVPGWLGTKNGSTPVTVPIRDIP